MPRHCQTQSSDPFEEHHTEQVGGPPHLKRRKGPQKHIERPYTLKRADTHTTEQYELNRRAL